MTSGPGEHRANLVYDDAKAAVVFFARAFGFTPGMLVGSGDLVLRAELMWKGRGVVVVEAAAEAAARGEAAQGAGSVSLAVDSPEEADALYARAVAAGARSTLAPCAEADGARRFQVADPQGVLWSFRGEQSGPAQSPQTLAPPQPPPLAQTSAE